MSAANPMPRYGSPTFDCGGAQIRSHFRHLAMVVTIHGKIDAANVDRVVAHTRHFVLTKERLVIDLSDAICSVAEGLSLLRCIAKDYNAAEVEWILVANPSLRDQLRDSDDEVMFPIADSVPEALHGFADVIDRRREVLLPLVRKSA